MKQKVNRKDEAEELGLRGFSSHQEQQVSEIVIDSELKINYFMDNEVLCVGL